MEGGDDAETGAGTAEGPEEVRVAGRGGGSAGTVRKNDVEASDCVDEKSPQART